MDARLKTEIWVGALIRRCAAENVPAVVVRHGDDQAGTVLVKVNRLDGTCMVYAPNWAPDGARQWLKSTGESPVADAAADAYIERQRAVDPDIWVVEIEDRAGRHFLVEPVA